MFKTSLLLLSLAGGLLAQDIQHINPPGIRPSPAYTHVVAAKPGTVLWLSGQVAQNAQGEVVGKGDLKAQLNQVWENIKLALAGGGATFKDVVKITTYVPNYKPSMLADIRETRARFMGSADPPASTFVGVQSLANEDWMVEIEVMAVVQAPPAKP